MTTGMYLLHTTHVRLLVKKDAQGCWTWSPGESVAKKLQCHFRPFSFKSLMSGAAICLISLPSSPVASDEDEEIDKMESDLGLSDQENDPFLINYSSVTDWESFPFGNHLDDLLGLRLEFDEVIKEFESLPTKNSAMVKLGAIFRKYK